MSRRVTWGAIPLFLVAAAAPAGAGVTNPQISIIGQPNGVWSDGSDDPDRNRLRLDAGETEIVYDDYLNPYARGYFTLSLGGEGMSLEEGYFTLFRGLPLDMALKGGRYRLPFGRLNQVHPHANPFAEPFGVLTAYLPGDESFSDVGVDLSRRFPVVGELSVNAELDYLQGNSFRVEREPEGAGDPLLDGGDDDAELTRPGFLGRLSGFTMVGERSALEFGVSAAGGTNNVAAGTRTTLLGVDAKAKLWRSESSYLVVQAEGIRLDREDAAWDPVDGYTSTSVTPAGGYVFADYNWGIRYNAGASVERYQEPVEGKPWTQGFGLFAGYALMEETTAIRLDWRHMKPEDGDGVNTVTLRVIYSMGPHKAHQF